MTLTITSVTVSKSIYHKIEQIMFTANKDKKINLELRGKLAIITENCRMIGSVMGSFATGYTVVFSPIQSS